MGYTKYNCSKRRNCFHSMIERPGFNEGCFMSTLTEQYKKEIKG